MEDQYYNPTVEAAQTVSAISEANQKQGAAQQQQYYIEEQEKTLAEAQLECDKTLSRIYHKLKQDYLEPLPDGRMEWKSVADSERVLTDMGVNKIMAVVESYVNKETLLSNFDDKQIPVRMLKFCNALNSNLYMKYEVYFRLPTMEECKVLLQKKITDTIDSRAMSIEIMGGVADKELIRLEVLEEFGSSLDDELKAIRVARMRENLREYELLFTQVEAIVDATHNRAWKGEERGSLRRHFNISEVIGAKPQNDKQGGLFSWGKH